MRGTWHERSERGDDEERGDMEREGVDDQDSPRDKPPHMDVHESTMEDELSPLLHPEPLYPQAEDTPGDIEGVTHEDLDIETTGPEVDMSMADLTSSMDTLVVSRARVPSVIRFGRGGGGRGGLRGGGGFQLTTPMRGTGRRGGRGGGGRGRQGGYGEHEGRGGGGGSRGGERGSRGSGGGRGIGRDGQETQERRVNTH